MTDEDWKTGGVATSAKAIAAKRRRDAAKRKAKAKAEAKLLEVALEALEAVEGLKDQVQLLEIQLGELRDEVKVYKVGGFV